MKYLLFHSSGLHFSSGLWKGCPWAEELSLCRATCCPPNPRMWICKRPVSTALAGRSHDMAFVSFLQEPQWSWPKTAAGDCQGMEAWHPYSSCQGGETSSLAPCLPWQPRKDRLLPPEWYTTCQEPERQETRSASRSPLPLFRGMEDKLLWSAWRPALSSFWKLTPPGQGPHPPPRSSTPSALAGVSRQSVWSDRF